MQRLQGLLEQLIWRLGRYFLADGKAVFSSLRELHPNREDFLDAFEAGDADGAEKAMMGFMHVRKAAYSQTLAASQGEGW